MVVVTEPRVSARIVTCGWPNRSPQTPQKGGKVPTPPQHLARPGTAGRMVVTMLAMWLLLMAPVGDLAGAFIPGRLILHRTHRVSRGTPHDRRYAAAILPLGARWGLSWCGCHLQSFGWLLLQFRGSGAQRVCSSDKPYEWVHRKSTLLLCSPTPPQFSARALAHATCTSSLFRRVVLSFSSWFVTPAQESFSMDASVLHPLPPLGMIYKQGTYGTLG